MFGTRARRLLLCSAADTCVKGVLGVRGLVSLINLQAFFCAASCHFVFYVFLCEWRFVGEWIGTYGNVWMANTRCQEGKCDKAQKH